MKKNVIEFYASLFIIVVASSIVYYRYHLDKEYSIQVSKTPIEKVDQTLNIEYYKYRVVQKNYSEMKYSYRMLVNNNTKEIHFTNNHPIDIPEMNKNLTLYSEYSPLFNNAFSVTYKSFKIPGSSSSCIIMLKINGKLIFDYPEYKAIGQRDQCTLKIREIIKSS